MAKSDPVEVAVEIIDGFSDELRELERRLDKIDGRRLNVELDIDAGDIEAVEARLTELERTIETQLNIDVDGYAKAKAMKENLEGDIRSTWFIDPRGGAFGIGNFVGGDGIDPPSTPKVSKEVIENIQAVEGAADHRGHRGFSDSELLEMNRWINGGVGRNFKGPSAGLFGVGEKYGPSKSRRHPTSAADDFLRAISHGTYRSRQLERAVSGFGDGFAPDVISSDFFVQRGQGNYFTPRWVRGLRRVRAGIGRTGRRAAGGFASGMAGGRSLGSGLVSGLANMETGGFQKTFQSMKGRLRKLVPTMQKWWKLVALLLPLMIALAGAVLGVAAALGALAVAGGAMIGLGLLGYGDSLAESMKKAGERVQDLKKELFEVFRPAASTFQPFVERLFDRLPALAERLVDPLQRLDTAGFDDFFVDALEGGVRLIEDLLNAASDLAPEIQAVGGAFGELIGDGLVGFLKALVHEVYNNWEQFVSLGAILGYIVLMIYNVSKAVSFMLTFLEPVFRLFAGLSSLLSNPFVAAIFAAVAAMTALFAVMSGVASLIGIIKGSAIAMAFYQMAVSAGTLTGALGAVKAALAFIISELTMIHVLTGGLLLLAGAVAGLATLEHMSGKSGDHTPSPSGGVPAMGSGASGAARSGTTINIYGDVRNREYQKLRDEFPDLYREQKTIDEETER